MGTAMMMMMSHGFAENNINEDKIGIFCHHLLTRMLINTIEFPYMG